MEQNNTYGDELPCGGFVEEDKFIQNNMKILSQQATHLQITSQDQCGTKQCCESTCKDTKKEQKTQTKSCTQNNTECSNCECVPIQKIEEKIEEKTTDRRIAKAICKKCKIEPSALVHKNQPICRECLLKNIEYKCRLTLQNSIKVQGTSKILICFSGGLNSICLVYILSNLKKRYQKHHLFGELRCIHIQQQQKIPQNYKEMFETETGIPLEILKIEEIFQDKTKSLDDVKDIFSMYNKSANSLDLLQLFRDKLIVNYAKQNQFDFIVKGLNGQSIAGSIFKYFTKGIGGNVTELSGTEQDCLYHNPLRQHLQKQLQYYFYTYKCSKISLISHDDDLSNLCSNYLDDTLNQFILNLQTMYTHTAPAVTRTAEKIQSNRKCQTRCKWCMLKGALETHGLCRKCERIYECKNKNFDNSKIPNWLKVAQ